MDGPGYEWSTLCMNGLGDEQSRLRTGYGTNGLRYDKITLRMLLKYKTKFDI